MKTDYAKKENRNFWLRHPTLGDPSFDTFEKVGNTVHKSEAPYEWGVNGSLFVDPKTGYFYLYAGIYPFGYAKSETNPCRFLIYKSADEGKTWANLGYGFELGFKFDGHDVPSDSCPDVVLTYDEAEDTYWLCYDWCDNNFTWDDAHKSDSCSFDSGAALAWAKSPEGPFSRLEKPFFSNKEQFGKFGIFSRGYASTLLKRRDDWIAFTLLDSGKYFSWGLACMTAKTPFGPWSEPVLLLSSARPEYYPAPVEFHPCFMLENKVYAPATSVSKNRSYQAVFAADREQSHLPSSWALESDGGVWHSRMLTDEQYGIWGQTIHGFVRENEFFVMYPAKDEIGYGTLSVAKRKWDEPFSDGFTFSGHAGKSISPLLAAYKDFTLNAELDYSGTIEIAFDYSGILGPDRHCSDASPHEQSFSSYYAMVLNETGEYRFIKKDKCSNELVIFNGFSESKIKSVTIVNLQNNIKVFINGAEAGQASVTTTQNPIAIVAREFSVLNCSKFEVLGDKAPFALKFNSLDAILNAGQLIENWTKDNTLKFQTKECLTGKGNIKAKWNFIGDSFNIYSPKSHMLGVMEVWVDGCLFGKVSLKSEINEASQIVYCVSTLEFGYHCVEVRPFTGKIAVDILEAGGDFTNEIKNQKGV